jgi:hypothetical protein
MSPQRPDPDTVATMRSKRRPGEQPKLSDDDDESTIKEKKSRWSLNSLGAILLLALAASLAISLALWTRLSRARDELASTEAAEANARLKQERRMAEEAQQSAVAVPVQTAPTPQVNQGPQRLILLLTVGTQHYAEKQRKLLQPKCPAAKLVVYRQKRGRCGWSACFAVAAKEADEEKARGCGETKGQALRDAQDFAAIN